jgi:hypothetical protein
MLAVWLIGSLSENSHIQLTVFFDRVLTRDAQFTFEMALCRGLGIDHRNLNFVNLNVASLSDRFRAISGKLLYEREGEYIRVSDFIKRTMGDYQEYALYRKKLATNICSLSLAQIANPS